MNQNTRVEKLEQMSNSQQSVEIIINWEMNPAPNTDPNVTVINYSEVVGETDEPNQQD